VTEEDTTGTGAVVRASVTNALTKFGGTGSDGALVITSGTTTIDLGAAQVVTKNYTSISITGTGVLAFTNPHANGTIIKLLSQGDVTLTSSATPMIDASGMGATGGAAGAVGKQGTSIIDVAVHYGGGGAANAAGGVGGLKITEAFGLYVNSTLPLEISSKLISAGSSAGGGGTSGTGAVGGAGGNGGGGLYIECRGAWNFTTTSGISVAGKNGENGGAGGGAASGGGGGGGSGGMFLALYNTLTSNSGTITVTAGTGGSGGTGAGGTNYTGGSGGGGAGQLSAAGTNGGSSSGSIYGSAGGAGVNGTSVVALNNWFI